jgi:guanylate kinase
MSEDLIPGNKKGFVLAVSAPSGTGKTSLCDKLRDELPYIVRSISVTTRPKRDTEVNGKDYIFVDKAEFSKMREAGQFLETAEVFGRFYGTPKPPVEAAIRDGRVMVMDIDTVGAMAIKEHYKKDAVSLFILPPTLAELESRLKGRGTDEPEVLERRLKEAAREIEESKRYEYVIANKMFDDAYVRLKSIVVAERSRRERLILKSP